MSDSSRGSSFERSRYRFATAFVTFLRLESTAAIFAFPLGLAMVAEFFLPVAYRRRREKREQTLHPVFWNQTNFTR